MDENFSTRLIHQVSAKTAEFSIGIGFPDGFDEV
jgi:hypothetical protein